MNLSIDILEAEGELNRQITAALIQFRKKITQDINKNQEERVKDFYDTSKSGSEKVFRFRESLLSLKFQINDYKTIYNMMLASFLILTFSLSYDAYTTKGSLIDIVAFNHFFRGWEKIFLTWWLIAVIHFTIIILTFIALKTSPKVYIPLYIIHQLFLINTGIKAVINQNLGFATIFIGLCQTTRMAMKSHSYFRTKVLYLTDNKYKKFNPLNEKAPNQPPLKITMSDFFSEIKRLSYFFLIPTLIYRDSYTLTPVRSLSRILTHLINFLACIYYSFILYVMACKQNIENLEQKLDFNTFLLTVIRLMLPSGFLDFCIVGQIFGHRLQGSLIGLSTRTGGTQANLVHTIGDGILLFTIDFRRFFSICRKNKFLAQLSTFMISAIFHEAIICLAIGFFYPILFILFTGPGIILIQNQRKLKSLSVNFTFWLELYIGTALLFSCYLVQSFARQVVSDQIVKKDFHSFSFLIPRTIYLGQIK